MSFWGTAAMVAWHDLSAGAEVEHDDWHSREHLLERVAIPGFRRGRRCRAIEAAEAYFLLYEVDDLATLTSPAYVDRLNDPTPWSQQVIPSIRNMTRTLCRLRTTTGHGVGTAVLTVRIAAPPTTRDALLRRCAERIQWWGQRERGVVAAHLLEGEPAASGIQTDEKRLRGGTDRVADVVMMVESYDVATLEQLREGELSRTEWGIQDADAWQIGLYQVVHIVAERDLPP